MGILSSFRFFKAWGMFGLEAECSAEEFRGHLGVLRRRLHRLEADVADRTAEAKGLRELLKTQEVEQRNFVDEIHKTKDKNIIAAVERADAAVRGRAN